jgi:hypothetical protein
MKGHFRSWQFPRSYGTAHKSIEKESLPLSASPWPIRQPAPICICQPLGFEHRYRELLRTVEVRQRANHVSIGEACGVDCKPVNRVDRPRGPPNAKPLKPRLVSGGPTTAGSGAGVADVVDFLARGCAAWRTGPYLRAARSIASIPIKRGGRREIRTHGGIAPSPVFKTGALNRSASLPFGDYSAAGSFSRQTYELSPAAAVGLP